MDLFLVSLGYIAWTLAQVRHPSISFLAGVAAGKDVDFFKRVFFEGVSTNGALPFVREIGGEDGGAFFTDSPIGVHIREGILIQIGVAYSSSRRCHDCIDALDDTNDE